MYRQVGHSFFHLLYEYGFLHFPRGSLMIAYFSDIDKPKKIPGESLIHHLKQLQQLPRLKILLLLLPILIPLIIILHKLHHHNKQQYYLTQLRNQYFLHCFQG